VILVILIGFLCFNVFSIDQVVFNHRVRSRDTEHQSFLIRQNVLIVDPEKDLVRVAVEKHTPRFETFDFPFIPIGFASPEKESVFVQDIYSLQIQGWVQYNVPFFPSEFKAYSCASSNFCTACNTYCLLGERALEATCGWFPRVLFGESKLHAINSRECGCEDCERDFLVAESFSSLSVDYDGDEEDSYSP